MTAATLDGPPPAVAGVFMGADYNTTFGTMSWVLPQPRAAPYFVAPVCVPDGTDPIANLAPGFAMDPVCTSPDCWVIGGPCPPNTINRCFSYSQSTMNGGVWGLAKVNASSYSTAGSAPMQIFAPVIGPEEQGFKASRSRALCCPSARTRPAQGSPPARLRRCRTSACRSGPRCRR